MVGGESYIRTRAGSAWAGQHFELFDSILGGIKKVTSHNHSLRVQYVRQCQEFDIDQQS